MEVSGGLAQVLPLPPPYEIDDVKAGLVPVQLKRALRGAAFMNGTLFLLRAEKVVQEESSHRLMNQVDAILEQISDLLRTVREAQA